jgi:UDP-N-acetylglucosamine 4,6-dehydratase/5-epimerase
MAKGSNTSASMTTVLITGGTGSLGQALTRFLLDRHDDIAIRIFSRDEQKQEAMKRAINDKRVRYLLGDVRDERRVRRAVRGCDAVIHGAALKIIPAGEYNPQETCKTNITGSHNVIEACIDAGVKRLVCVSSDKAVAPVNLYGATKMCMEKLATLASQYSVNTDVVVVRYGNVIGTRASILTMLKGMAASGSIKITGTPQMTRFWITLQQACEFVTTALWNGESGAIYIPKLRSTRVEDLCHHLYPLTPIEYVSMRPGDREYEWMSNEYEVLEDADWAYVIRLKNHVAGSWVPGQRPYSSADCVVPAAELLSEPGFAEEVRRAAA